MLFGRYQWSILKSKNLKFPHHFRWMIWKKRGKHYGRTNKTKIYTNKHTNTTKLNKTTTIDRMKLQLTMWLKLCRPPTRDYNSIKILCYATDSMGFGRLNSRQPLHYHAPNIIMPKRRVRPLYCSLWPLRSGPSSSHHQFSSLLIYIIHRHGDGIAHIYTYGISLNRWLIWTSKWNGFACTRRVLACLISTLCAHSLLTLKFS